MKRASLLVLAGTILVTGCRVIIGVEDVIIDVGDAGGGGSPQNEAGAPEDAASPGDAGTDTGSPTPGMDAGACASKMGGECLKCCKETFPQQAPKIEQTLIAHGCVCGTGLCVAECGTTLCASQPPPSATCGPCVDSAVKSGLPKCEAALGSCRTQPQLGCVEIAACMDACL